MTSGVEKWFSTAEAARRLGVAPPTVYRLIDDGDLIGYRIGRVIRLRAADLEQFLKRARIEPGSLRHLRGAGTSCEPDEPGDGDDALRR